MPAKKINIAVAGLGFMGVTHLRVYQQIPNARIIAVCDMVRLPENGILKGVAGNITKSGDLDLGAALKVYRDFEEMVSNPDVDVVDICTPTSLHPSQAIAALKAGKHVLCEKPIAMSSADASKVLKAASAAKTFLMPAMCMRFWPGWDWLKQVVEEKTFGKVLAMNFRRLSVKPSWGSSKSHFGGALFDLHIHDTDFVNYLFGMPDSVYSSGVCDAEGNADQVVTQYAYKNGPVVSAEGSWLLPQGFNMAFNMTCEQATLDFDFSRGENALQISRREGKVKSTKLAKHDGYTGEIRYFLDCVAKGRSPIVVTPADSVTTLKICEAEQKSVHTGRIVKL